MELTRKIGSKEYKKLLEGKKLTRKEAILAFCYDCNGQHEMGKDSKIDCRASKCALYGYFPYKGR